jgi:hypothetical protein
MLVSMTQYNYDDINHKENNDGINIGNNRDDNNADSRNQNINHNDDKYIYGGNAITKMNKNEDMIINDNYNYDMMFKGWSEEHCDRLRALLETILISDYKYSVIWILYIHLECHIKNYANSKKLFFRYVYTSCIYI